MKVIRCTVTLIICFSVSTVKSLALVQYRFWVVSYFSINLKYQKLCKSRIDITNLSSLGWVDLIYANLSLCESNTVDSVHVLKSLSGMKICAYKKEIYSTAH